MLLMGLLLAVLFLGYHFLSIKIKMTLLKKSLHDLRTPASGVYSLSCALHEKMDDPHLKHLQSLIVSSSEELLLLLDGLQVSK